MIKGALRPAARLIAGSAAAESPKSENLQDLLRDEDIGWLDVSVALHTTSIRVLHSQTELNCPLHCLLRRNRLTALQVVEQTDAPMIVGFNEVHRNKQAPREYLHPLCLQNERMLSQIDPKECLLFEGFSSVGVRQEFISEGLQGTDFPSLQVSDEIDHTEPALAERA